MSAIRILAMDVDGTMTDGRICMCPDGELFKSFDVRDGYAISTMLPRLGIVPVVITSRESAIVERRCAELCVGHLHQGVSDKLTTLKGVCAEIGCTLSDVCYMGDDLNDLPCIEAVCEAGGTAACPADAAIEVRAAATYVCAKKGGRGAVRELVEELRLWNQLS